MGYPELYLFDLMGTLVHMPEFPRPTIKEVPGTAAALEELTKREGVTFGVFSAGVPREGIIRALGDANLSQYFQDERLIFSASASKKDPQTFRELGPEIHHRYRRILTAYVDDELPNVRAAVESKQVFGKVYHLDARASITEAQNRGTYFAISNISQMK